jgi:hypothetical protein
VRNDKKIMIIGAGDIGRRVFYAMAHSAQARHLVLAGRDAEAVTRFVNMTRFSALQCGFTPTLTATVTDLDHVDDTAAQLAAFAPDVVFGAASVQSWWVLFNLPKPKFEPLYRAAYGPWLPMHLAPAAKLMRAVRLSGTDAVVVNAAYPDAVHPLLHADGLSPHVGIGNVANNVPALRFIAADRLGVDAADVLVRFVAHHFVSHRVSRSGDSGGAAYDLRVFAGGERADVGDEAMLFQPLLTTYRRTGGVGGQAMTAASALSVLEPLATGADVRTHAPGPGGLVGGYPVRIHGGAVALDLDPAMTEPEAVDVNVAGQRYDGIASIGADGYVEFEDWAAGIMEEELGYTCRRMHWKEADDRAEELRRKFLEYEAR